MLFNKQQYRHGTVRATSVTGSVLIHDRPARTHLAELLESIISHAVVLHNVNAFVFVAEGPDLLQQGTLPVTGLLLDLGEVHCTQAQAITYEFRQTGTNAGSSVQWRSTKRPNRPATQRGPH